MSLTSLSPSDVRVTSLWSFSVLFSVFILSPEGPWTTELGGLVRPKFALIRRLSWKKLVSYCEIFPDNKLLNVPWRVFRLLGPCSLLTFSTILVILSSHFAIALITINCKCNFCFLSKILLRFKTLRTRALRNHITTPMEYVQTQVLKKVSFKK